MQQSNDTIVIGGGISGLTAAWRLNRAGRRVLLLEASLRIGGAIQTTRRDGFLLEHGPFNVLVRSAEFRRMLHDLRDTLPIVRADREVARNRFVMSGGKLHRAPAGPGDLLFNSLLSPPATLRMLRGLLISRPRRDDRETLDMVARRRLGDRFADTLASALSVGIFGAESTDIEFSSCVPRIARIDRNARSPLLAMLRAKHDAHESEKIRGLVSFEEGLAALPRTLADELGDSVCMDSPVKSITRQNDGSWGVQCARREEPTVLTADNIVLAVGHEAAAKMLGPIDDELSGIIGSVSGSSMLVLNLGFRREQVRHPLNGYGLLAAGSERTCPYLGVLWASSVFPHHAPAGYCVMRVFRGGSRHPGCVEMSDAENVDAVMDNLRETLQITGDPALIHICRWPNAIPLYAPGHGEKIRRANEIADRIGGLYLAGNYTDGISIGSCVERGDRIAYQILAQFPRAIDSNQTGVRQTSPTIVAQ